VDFLYRGVNPELYEKLHGELRPKEVGKKFSSVASCGDPHAVCGSGVMCGESVANEVIFHQWEQKGYPTSGISTTPFIDRAKFYALTDGKFAVAYIYELSVHKLSDFGVSIYRVNDLAKIPAIPEDDEHILVAKDFKSIPVDAIVRVTMIRKSI